MDWTIEHTCSQSASIHEQSLVEEPCVIRDRSRVLPFAHLMGPVIVGQDCTIGHHVIVHAGVVMGNAVQVHPFSLISSGVILEDDVRVGSRTQFCPPGMVRARAKALSRISPTLVRRGARLATLVTVENGHTLGCYSFVEAGTVVDRSVPDYAVVAGQPMQLLGWRCDCREWLEFGRHNQTECSACGKTYYRVNEYHITLLAPPEEPPMVYSRPNGS